MKFKFPTLSSLRKLITPMSEQEQIDAYITSKNPTTTAEVEYWLAQYDRRHIDISLQFSGR